VVTLRDLSKKVGLSVTQTSRAMNGHSDVNPKTMERVRMAAQEIGYKPNLSARALVTGQSPLIGLIRQGHLKLPEDTVLVETITGLSREFTKLGLRFVVQMSPSTDNVFDIYRSAINSKAFGAFVLVEVKENDPRIDTLLEANVPFFTHGRASGVARYGYVDIDNFEVALQQTSHLLELGHKCIGFMSGPEQYSFSQRRVEGYREAFRSHDLPVDERLIDFTQMSEDCGMISTIQMCRASQSAPTALVCANLLQTMGAYRALRSLGFAIPQDVSIVSHDDNLQNYPATNFFPPVTTTSAPFDEVWPKIAKGLNKQMRSTRNQSDEFSVVEPTVFIERQSTAPFVN